MTSPAIMSDIFSFFPTGSMKVRGTGELTSLRNDLNLERRNARRLKKQRKLLLILAGFLSVNVLALVTFLITSQRRCMSDPVPENGTMRMTGWFPTAGRKLSMEYKQVKRKGKPKILLAGGSSDYATVSYVDPSKGQGDTYCFHPAKLPFPGVVDGAVGDFVSGQSWLCGGFDARGELSKVCYSFNVTSNTWSISSLMLTARQSPTAVVVAVKENSREAEELWLFGGKDVQGNVLTTTERIVVSTNYGGATSLEGPDMPMPISGHCAVHIDDDQVLLAGGVDSRGRLMKDIHILNLRERHYYKPSGQMPIAMTGHFCGLTEGHVVVGGGEDRRIVQILSVKDWSWRRVSDLAVAGLYPISLRHGVSSFLVMAFDGEIFAYDEATLKFEKLRALHTQTRRAVAIPLYTSFTPVCS